MADRAAEDARIKESQRRYARLLAAYERGNLTEEEYWEGYEALKRGQPVPDRFQVTSSEERRAQTQILILAILAFIVMAYLASLHP